MIQIMTLIGWQSSTAGSRIRVALWLVQEIGEGGTFRKAQLRTAFPAVEQIDRRMRDLREDGWVFATNREDLSLAPDELRLVRVGARVWDASYRRPRAQTVLASDRKATFAADGFACRYCGVAAGEPFPDEAFRIAKLSVTRISGSGSPALLTLCDRCLAASSGESSGDAAAVAREVGRLGPDEREQLLAWMSRGERGQTGLDRAWARWRALPHDLRDDVKAQLQAQTDCDFRGR